MTTEKMTIHKALCELKTLDSRIQDAIRRSTFCFANKHSNQKIHGIPIEDVKKECKAAYQSISDLISRRNAIKCAVVLSNATTKVTIGGKEYTVAEAIEMKNNGMALLKYLLDKLAGDYRSASRECDESNGDRLERRADDYLKTLYTGFDPKNLSAEIKTTRENLPLRRWSSSIPSASAVRSPQ